MGSTDWAGGFQGNLVANWFVRVAHREPDLFPSLFHLLFGMFPFSVFFSWYFLRQWELAIFLRERYMPPKNIFDNMCRRATPIPRLRKFYFCKIPCSLIFHHTKSIQQWGKFKSFFGNFRVSSHGRFWKMHWWCTRLCVNFFLLQWDEMGKWNT